MTYTWYWKVRHEVCNGIIAMVNLNDTFFVTDRNQMIIKEYKVYKYFI